MNYLELTTAVTAIANAIATMLTPSEIALASGLFVQLYKDGEELDGIKILGRAVAFHSRIR